jgi:hypothetical protein
VTFLSTNRKYDVASLRTDIAAQVLVCRAAKASLRGASRENKPARQAAGAEASRRMTELLSLLAQLRGKIHGRKEYKNDGTVVVMTLDDQAQQVAPVKLEYVERSVFQCVRRLMDTSVVQHFEPGDAVFVRSATSDWWPGVVAAVSAKRVDVGLVDPKPTASEWAGMDVRGTSFVDNATIWTSSDSVSKDVEDPNCHIKRRIG